MDNYKHPKKHENRASLDGILSPDGFKKQSGSIGFGASQSVKSTNLITDNFDLSDGYHPTIPQVAGTEVSTGVLPTEPRRRFASDQIHTNHAKSGWRNKIFKKPKSWKRFFKRVALVILSILILTGAFLAYKFYNTQKQVFTGGGQAPAVCNGDVPLDRLDKEGDGNVNILLVGIGGPGHPGADLTDTLIIASVDTINDKIELLSIPRDFWVQVPQYGSTKINAVYSDAKQRSSSKNEKDKIKDGLKVLDGVVTNILGIPIHYNTVVNFKAFKDSVNSVGGITVNVPETLYDPTVAWENNYNPVVASKGSQKFTGNTALLYARSRQTSSGGDFDRAERQRLILVALKDRVLSLGTFSNPLKISGLLDSFGNNVYTDFDLGSVKCLYEQVSQIQSQNIKSLDLVTPPNDLLASGNISNLSTLVPKAGTFVYSDIQSFVRNALRDSFLLKENAQVLVLNGSNISGLAAKQTEILKSYGYRVAKSGDASTNNYQKTMIINLRDGNNKYTQHYLENRFNVKVESKLPDNSINTGTADFVIILGADASTSN